MVDPGDGFPCTLKAKERTGRPVHSSVKLIITKAIVVHQYAELRKQFFIDCAHCYDCIEALHEFIDYLQTKVFKPVYLP